MARYQGSCHCGSVRFDCDLDLAAGTSRCNCSVCAKGRFWKAVVTPQAFQLLAGAEALADYQFGPGRIHHRFCRHCGVKTFGEADIPGLGAIVAVNLACLDGVPDDVLAAAPVAFEDGRHDRWEVAPAVTSHL